MAVEGVETLKKPRGVRKPKIQLATKIWRSLILLRNMINDQHLILL